MTQSLAESYGNSRYVQRTDQQQRIQLFFDHSVLEVFLNNGKNTMTARVFIEDLSILSLSSGVDARLYYLNSCQYDAARSGSA